MVGLVEIAVAVEMVDTFRRDFLNPQLTLPSLQLKLLSLLQKIPHLLVAVVVVVGEVALFHTASTAG